MKTPPNKQPSSPNTGMTLIELTVVILVMFGLISITFVGASAWKRGSDRSQAILLIRSAQQGMRSHCQITGTTDSSYLDMPNHVFGPDRFVHTGTDRNTGLAKPVGDLPDHPVPSSTFDFVAGDGDIIPPFGELYICTGGAGGLSNLDYNPSPDLYQYW